MGWRSLLANYCDILDNITRGSLIPEFISYRTQRERWYQQDTGKYWTDLRSRTQCRYATALAECPCDNICDGSKCTLSYLCSYCLCLRSYIKYDQRSAQNNWFIYDMKVFRSVLLLLLEIVVGKNVIIVKRVTKLSYQQNIFLHNVMSTSLRKSIFNMS